MQKRVWIGIPILLIGLVALTTFWQTQTAPKKSVAPEQYPDIHIEVLNGCGKDGLARQVGDRLRDLGFDVVTVGNAGTYSYPETLVIDRMGKPEFARRVAELLGVNHPIQQIMPDPFRVEEVTVIVGKDYRRLSLLSSR